MVKVYLGVLFAVCGLTCAKLPSPDTLHVLKLSPTEVLFRVTESQEPFLIECVVKSTGRGVTYSWHKNGKPLSLEGLDVVQRHGEGSLVFLKPSASDAGDYRCFATSDMGTASSGVYHVREMYIKAPNPIPQKLKPVENKPLKLECNIPDSYPKPEITWRYQPVLDPNISNEVLDERMTISPEGSLYITSVEKRDANKNFKYVCLAITPAAPRPVPLAEYVIEEVVPNDEEETEVTELYTSKDMTVEAGYRTYIYCIFGGLPQPVQDYFKDGANVNGKPNDRVTRYNRSRGKRLLIRDNWLTDTGSYKCVASNGVGKPKEHTMKLTVVSRPHAVKMPIGVLGDASGVTVTIPCQATGVPAPKLTWTYNAQPLKTSENLVISHSTKGNFTVADLTIKNTKVTDRGYYGCTAQNEYGEIYRETLLNIA